MEFKRETKKGGELKIVIDALKKAGITHTKFEREFRGGVAILADNREVMPLLKEAGYKADFLFTDPPYGINATSMSMGTNPKRLDCAGNISTATKLKGRLNSGAGKLKNRLLNQSSIDWDGCPPTEADFKTMFELSDNQIIWGGNYFNLPPTRCVIAWDKRQPWKNFSQFELAWTSLDKPARLYSISNTGGQNREVKFHPTQKPLALFSSVFWDFIGMGATVIDPYAGSMTTAIAAFHLGCYFICIERNETYYQNGVARINDYINQLTLEL